MKLENTRFAASLLINWLATRPQTTVIFDLDGVLLSAEHRIKLLPTGALDLDHYRANTTAEQVALDRDLPLVAVVDWLNKQGRPYHVATARVACQHTLNRLDASEIKPSLIMPRLGHGDRRGDALLKQQHFLQLFDESQRPDLVLIDDLAANCQAAAAIGMQAIQIDTSHGVLMR